MSKIKKNTTETTPYNRTGNIRIHPTNLPTDESAQADFALLAGANLFARQQRIALHAATARLIPAALHAARLLLVFCILAWIAPGCKAQTITIYRDSYGVPSIVAERPADA